MIDNAAFNLASLRATPMTLPDGVEMMMIMVTPAEYEQLVEMIEDFSDIAAYDRVKQRLAEGAEELIPAEVVDRLLDGENPLRVWREHRGKTLSILAREVGIAPPYLSELETGKKEGSLSVLQKLAVALLVELADIVPPPRPKDKQTKSNTARVGQKFASHDAAKRPAKPGAKAKSQAT